jgi:ABC-2 type transport system permease protein
MTGRRGIWEVGRREFAERWRSKAMRASFVISILLVAAAAVVATVSDKGPATDDFGLVGSRAAVLVPALRQADRAADRSTRIHRFANRAAAVRAVREGDVDVVILADRLLVKESRTGAAVGIAQRAIAGQRALDQLTRAGLTRERVLAMLSVQPARVDVMDASATDRRRDEGMLWVGVLILFLALVIYGQSVASSVMGEKSSRVIELLLTSLSPRRLLAGKVLGVGALGVLQVAAISATALISARIAGGKGLPPTAPETIALVIGWFILGFAFYSVLYAALGALVSRQEDLDATTAPVNVLLVAAYWGSLAALADPNGTWAQIAAFLPPLAPMVVPTRMVLGDMNALGLMAATAVEIVAIIAMVAVAAAIYERVVMRIGAPIRLRAALAGGSAGRPRVLAGLHRYYQHQRPTRP